MSRASFGSVYELAPGQTLPLPIARKDWSPIAQPPDRHGILAHTPDPSAYHNLGYGTMLPRGTVLGGPQGQSHKPGKVFIDPLDPVTGAGGIPVDLRNIPQEVTAAAAAQSGGDPMAAWVLTQHYSEQVKQQGGVPMPAPVVSQAPPPVSQPAPLVPQGPQQPQQGEMGIMAQRLADMAAEIQALRAAQRPQFTPPTQPLLLPPVPAHLLQPGIAPADGVYPQPPQYPASQLGPHAAPQPQQQLQAVPQIQPAEVGPALPDEIGLSFLTNPPSKPQFRVAFDLGRGGQHMKRFHSVAIHGNCLSLVIDSRYDGDFFVPPVTGEHDEPFLVDVPLDGDGKPSADRSAATTRYRCMNPDFNQRLGCLDIINLAVVPSDDDQTQPLDDGAVLQMVDQAVTPPSQRSGGSPF